MLLRYDEGAQRLVEGEWDPALDRVRHRMRDPGPGSALAEGLPGLVLAVHEPGELGAGGGDGWNPPRDHLVVRFDPAFITETLLPRLADLHLGRSDGLVYSLTIACADRPEEIVFTAGPPPSAAGRQGDVTAQLFALRAGPEGPGQRPGRIGPRPLPREGPRQAGDGRRGDLGFRARRPAPRPPESGGGSEAGRWRLTVRHPAGSLEEAVASARRRNLAISVATLAMLGATALLMVGSSRRAQRLARQQMDFVAGVSHELRTPLTAIRSAGQNLADGIIDEPDRVRSYGLLIEREGRRLTEMIARVLTFSGIQSGQQRYRMQRVGVGELVGQALEDCRWVLEERGFEVQTRIPGDPLPVQGDAQALRQVFANLLDNAIKYGASGRWLGIRARHLAGVGEGEVVVSISDRGAGIAKRELAHVFEPFRRGADVVAGSIPGSGLGLAVVRSIVEAHGGRIEVRSPQAGGATFTVCLPAAAAEAEEVGR